jgi:GH24 family phage-related lysozyme (muramidase)
MITFNTFSDPSSYSNSRYGFILGVEEGGVPNLDPYVDSQGIPTIGLGFNLN